MSVRNAVFAVLFALVLCLPAMAQDSANLTAPNDQMTTDSTTNVAQVADTAKPLYPPTPERMALLISYSKFVNIWRFAEFFISVIVLLVVLFTGLSAILQRRASSIHSPIAAAADRFIMRFDKWNIVVRILLIGWRLIAMLIRSSASRQWLYFAFLMLVIYVIDFPANYYRNFVIENDYGFSNQNFLQWWGDDLKSLAVTIVLGIIGVWLLYFVINRFKRWWLVFSIGAVPFMIFFVVIAPVVISPLFNKFEPLKDKMLETKLLTLADQVGIPGSHVFEVDASKQSNKINAYVTGLLNTKRIVLYDTIIKNFTQDEIMFVMGHEMGHYVMHHVWLGLSVFLVFLIFCLWLINTFIHRLIHQYRNRLGFDRINDIASLPLLLLCLTVVMFIGQPVTNSVSRSMEHAADTFGMEHAGVSGEVAASAFDKLSVFNLSDPDPNTLTEIWFYDHPAIKKRIEYVRSFGK